MSMHTLRFSFLLVLVPCMLAVSGCDFNGNDEVRDRIRERLQSERQKWEDQDISRYQLVYSQQAGSLLVDTVRVFVSGGTVDSTVAPDEVPDEDLLVGTVDSYFNLIEARIGEDDSGFRAEFDEEQGFPITYTANFFDGRADQAVETISLMDSSGAANSSLRR